MKGICGVNCDSCEMKINCKGCEATGGKPFDGTCIAAEYIKVGGIEAFSEFKMQLMNEINELHVEGMPEIKELFCLCGSFVNLQYPLVNGTSVKFLEDRNIYLGAQVESPHIDRCYGVVADTSFILVCEYGEGGSNPEIILYKKR